MMGFERRWARHVLAAFAPIGGPGLAPLQDEVDYESALRRMMRGASPLAAAGMRLALWIAALAPIWLWGRVTTVTRLAVERRPELLRQLLGHRAFAVRELTLLLKLCAAMALLGTPSVRARSGYDDVPVRPITVRPAPVPTARLRLPQAALEPRRSSQAAASADPGAARAPRGGA
jgi:hypothetical protein